MFARLTSVAGILVLAVILISIAATLQSAAQSPPPTVAPAGPLNTLREVWVALRTDGQAGSGGVTDPFDASSVEKVNALFARFEKDYGDNLTIHLGPGVFYGDRLITLRRNNWKIRGAGRDITILRTRPDATATD